MKNGELIALWNLLTNPSMTQHKGVKFGFARAKNKGRLESEIKILQKSQGEISEPLSEFEDKRMALCEECADKDDDGKPIKSGQNFEINDRREEFDSKFEELRVEFKDAFDEAEKRRKEFVELLDAESDFTPHMISLSELPDTLSALEIEGLMGIIKED